MKKNDPRQLAFEVLSQVEEGAFADLALDGALSRSGIADPRDRGLATELVYGVLRCRGRLDFALSRISRQPLRKLETAVLTLLRLGAYQMLHLERVPERAAVNETVALTHRLRLSRASGFINGILRNLARRREELAWPDRSADPLGHLEHALSLPAWLARRWRDELGVDEALALGAAMLDPAPFTVRVNTLKTDRDTYLTMLREAGFEAEATRFAPEGVRVARSGGRALPGDVEGLYQVQDEASMLIAHLVAPQEGETLLDACAAPGGKTTQLASLAGNRAAVTALELHPRRVALIERGAARLGCEGITARPWDLSAPPPFLAPASCDRVLVDAPCSGLGVLRRNPETRWRRTPEEIAELAALQLTILANVAPLVRPGGVLIYSLCTITPEETEEVVAAFLATHPEFEREDLREVLVDSWHELVDGHGALRTLPHRHDGMDAFYAVRFSRRG